ncbi:unnamed protein product [Bursaphelenchus okinawaensis]|uniref:Elongation of very long chain fatty acids protein n=1 Tax=Bursaphelenchus okinawaensis TaxID=465554 RepID=A0A811L8J6_9BILA|nr:unnamed protein product [Bursaphelenchus okinawaensis]CAG9118305.1 unnamed protein product [Bursaphelenchus okinawaensis]
MAVEVQPAMDPTFESKKRGSRSHRIYSSAVLLVVLVGSVYFKEVKEFVKSFDPFLGQRLVMYQGEGGQKWLVPHSNYNYTYKAYFEDFVWNESAFAFINKYWLICLPIGYLYYFGIHRLEAFMKNREPMKLQTTLVLWNLFLGLFSIAGFVRVVEEYYYVVSNFGFYNAICNIFSPNGPAFFWSVMFTVSKVLELGDTVFLVLRKKPVIFLHSFHHMFVMVIVFHAVAEMGAPAITFMLMNYFAHSIMYPYYAAMAAGIRVPRPLAKCITVIQITQMFLGVMVTTFTVYKRDIQGEYCQTTRFSTLLSYTTYVAFGWLFVQFFLKAYAKKPRTAEKKHD